MAQPTESQNPDEIAAYKVKKRVAKQGVRRIQQQVDEIEQQVADEKHNARFLLPILVLLLVVLLVLVFSPDLFREFSQLLNVF